MRMFQRLMKIMVSDSLAEAVHDRKLNNEDKSIACGLLNQMCASDNKFMFLNAMILEILSPLNIMTKTLQSSTENIASALSIVKSIREELKEIRQNITDEKCEKKVKDLKDAADVSIEVEMKVKRKRFPKY